MNGKVKGLWEKHIFQLIENTGLSFSGVVFDLARPAGFVGRWFPGECGCCRVAAPRYKKQAPEVGALASF
jgi:hypothetical protein